MPSQRLLTMGLLSKYPAKSTVLQAFTAPVGTRGRDYTEFERMHIVALWYTPGITKQWIFEQLEKYGLSPKASFERFKRIVRQPKNAKWKPLGPRNVLHIGQPEVERYFTRSNIKQLHVPQWALPIFNDELKRGLTQSEVVRKYGITHKTLRRCMQRSMFDEPFKPNWPLLEKVDGQPFK